MRIPNRKLVLLHCAFLLAIVGAGATSTAAQANADDSQYTRLNTWAFFAEYAPNSSHMVLGVSEQRRLVTAGAEWDRRITRNDKVEFDWVIQVRPFALESDPVFIGFKNTATNQIVVPATPTRVITVEHGIFPLAGGATATQAYTRQWTYAGGLNPLGFKFNFRPRHRVQPVFTAIGGFLRSTRDIPVENVSDFNFDFEFGVGIEAYVSNTRSLRVSWSFHHISDAYISSLNPGIDQGLIQISYAFGH
ncbi:MAG TPA: acyloxyacyl hydrolase [Candidatus Acidoferrales bacterium]|nr:acyloxyacyl hydrolase [Candidatus Acidoferrales bacterium]